MKWILPILLLPLISCKKDSDDDIIYGYEYFPVDSGHYVIYDVVDIFHDELLLQHDTAVYQIKELIGEEDVDLEGESYKKFYRYFRLSDTLDWQLKDVWALKQTSNSIQLVEENKRKIKMAFSISYDQYWNCNAYNNDEPEQCYYQDIYEPYSLEGIDYDSSVIVVQQNFDSYIEHIKKYEVYAPRIGRVEGYYVDLDINNGDSTDISYGTELFYKAVSWN
jgi:hypothetical protein